MTNFDERAREWDKNEMHVERAIATAAMLEKMIPLCDNMKALEYGAGTGILSFLMKDWFSEITLMDSSPEMIKVCEAKTQYYNTHHMKPILFDLEQMNFDAEFDLIYSQMVLHHINDVEGILKKFYTMLNAGGYLAIADLFTEDGSFHGPDMNVHKGFDPDTLKEILESIGFKNSEFNTCFEIKREQDRTYPLFLLAARK